jgi:probable HAF family extracellular repeat protein
MTDLGTMGGIASGALAINERGQVVVTYDRSGANRLFLWEAGKSTDLGTLGGSFSGASAGRGIINERGQVVGQSETAAGESHAVLWMLKSGAVP